MPRRDFIFAVVGWAGIILAILSLVVDATGGRVAPPWVPAFLWGNIFMLFTVTSTVLAVGGENDD